MRTVFALSFCSLASLSLLHCGSGDSGNGDPKADASSDSAGGTGGGSTGGTAGSSTGGTGGGSTGGSTGGTAGTAGTDAGLDAPADSGADTFEAGPPACEGRASCQVFATSTELASGNLAAIAGTATGYEGANKICQDLATAASLVGTFKAWIADHAGHSPSTTFSRATVPYKLVDGTVIAADWDDLTDGSLDEPIDLTEQNTAVSSRAVAWTSTNADGTLFTDISSDCAGWTSGANSASGYFGNPNATSSAWAGTGAQACDNDVQNPLVLYCFEQ